MSGIKSFVRKVKTKLGSKEDAEDTEPESITETGNVEKECSSEQAEKETTETEAGEAEGEDSETDTGAPRGLARDLGKRFGYSLLSYSSVLVRWENQKPEVGSGRMETDSPDIIECILRKGKWRVSYTIGPNSWCIDSADDRREALKTVCWVMENGIDENVREMRENHNETAVSGS
jgi:hypothetical protein